MLPNRILLSIWTTVANKATAMEHNNLLDLVKEKLEESLSLKILNFEIEPRLDNLRPDFIADISFKKWRFKLFGEILNHQSASIFKHALYKLQLCAAQRPDLVPILIAKYLSPPKQQECKEAGINFMDLSGNVFFQFEEALHIERRGFSNQFPEIRRGRNPFSDKASLLLRAMLKKKKNWGVRELADEIRLNPGYVSRMFKELEELRYLMRVNSKAKLINQESLLEDWIHHYDYKKNRFIRYFCQAKSAQEIIDRLERMEIAEKANYALGFHAGAFLVSPHAAFNEVHIYISDEKSSEFFKGQLKLKAVERGANVIFVLPYYKHSAFYDLQKIKGLKVVSYIQLYLDLYHYPFRGLEQAEHLYGKRIKAAIETNKNEDSAGDG